PMDDRDPVVPARRIRLAHDEGSPMADTLRGSAIRPFRSTTPKLANDFTALVLFFIWVGDSWWQLVTAAVFAVVFTQIAMLGHDAAHRQIFRSGRWNDWTTLVIGNLLVGMSYGWWQHKHT